MNRLRAAMMTRLAIVATALVAVAGLSACGVKEDRVHHAATEGIYVDVGSLKYQVQISRQLNPVNIEDKDYLLGLSPFDRTLGSDNVWFAVFIRVENDSDNAAVSAKTFQLRDTQENVFTPIVLARDNIYAYHAARVDGHSGFNVNGTYPVVNSSAAAGPTAGALLLFKLPRTTLVNRPLELVIAPGSAEKSIVDLDV
jgi:hypothetical protein